MTLSGLNDTELLSELRFAQEAIPRLVGQEAALRAAWRRAIGALRELEKRYPPSGSSD